jgi:hypothetical protein
VDGLIYASSMVLLDSARREVPVPALAQRLLGQLRIIGNGVVPTTTTLQLVLGFGNVSERAVEYGIAGVADLLG